MRSVAPWAFSPKKTVTVTDVNFALKRRDDGRAWPQDLERSPELIIVDLESKNRDEKAASKRTVDEEPDGSEFAGRPS